MNFLPSSSFGTYLGQFVNFDVNDSDLRLLLQQIYFQFAYQINQKDNASYETIEQLNGQQFFDPANPQNKRYVYRKVIDFGTLPNAGVSSVAHNIPIDANTIFTRIYGTANDTTGNNYIPLPYASPTLANNIQLDVDATNVTITTGSNRTNFTISYVILEYIKG